MVLEESTVLRDSFASDDDDASPDGYASGTPTKLRRFTVDTEASATVTPDELQLNYRVSGGPPRRYRLRFDRMPLQGITRAAAFGSNGVASQTARSLVNQMSTIDKLNGRPLTQTEAEGLALHASRKQLYAVAAFYGSIALGGLIAYSKRKTFKFPLRKPKPVEQYDSFPLQRVPLLSAQYSRAAWHLTRGFAYIGATTVLLMPFCGSLARTSEGVYLMRDQRTRDVIQEAGVALQRVQREKQGDLRNKNRPSARREQAVRGADQTDSDASADGDYYGGSQGDYFQEDDNSPTSSQYASSDTSSTGVLSDVEVQSRARSQRSSPSSSEPSNSNTFEIERVERQPRSFDSEYNNSGNSSSSSSPFYDDDDDDDASPTTGNGPYPPSASMSSSTSGSAWARIRKSAATSDASALPSYPTPPSSATPPSPPPSVDPTNKQGILSSHMRQSRPQPPRARQLQQNSVRDEYETNGDNFSFSKEGAERQLAKEQAQKEFDQMVEAERRGHGPSSQAGGGGDSGAGETAWGRRRGS